MRFPLSLTHQTPLVNAIKFDASVADIAKRWKLHLNIFAHHQETANRTTPGKRTAGTEINFTFFDEFIYFEDLSEQNLI